MDTALTFVVALAGAFVFFGVIVVVIVALAHNKTPPQVIGGGGFVNPQADYAAYGQQPVSSPGPLYSQAPPAGYTLPPVYGGYSQSATPILR